MVHLDSRSKPDHAILNRFSAEFVSSHDLLPSNADSRVMARYVTCRSLAPIRSLEHPPLQWIRVTFVIFSLVCTLIAQAQISEEWRIGIGTEHRMPLVQKESFVSREIRYIGIVITLSGLFLIIPNALTLLILIVGLRLIEFRCVSTRRM